jgi:hypothetical protein
MPRAYSRDLRESFVINLMTAYRARGSLAPKRLGGRRQVLLQTSLLTEFRYD